MNTAFVTPKMARHDVFALEADIAFFEARISLAGEAPDTAYQRAQIKTYQTLGSLISESLNRLRRPAKAAAVPWADTKLDLSDD